MAATITRFTIEGNTERQKKIQKDRNTLILTFNTGSDNAEVIPFCS